MIYTSPKPICPCGSVTFHNNPQQYDSTHEKEDREYSWANVPAHRRKDGVVTYNADGTIDPPEYRRPPNRWTTRQQRLDNPTLALAVQNSYQKCMWISDDTWLTCHTCKKDLDGKNFEDALEHIRDVDRMLSKAWENGTLKIVEERGPVIINDRAMSQIDIKENLS